MNNMIHGVSTVAVASLVTIAIRFIPFILFPESREVPKLLTYFSKVLPAAIMGMLVVYCFRNTAIIQAPHGIPELIATAIVAGSYVWKKNILLSIASGTVIYMILVQLVFI